MATAFVPGLALNLRGWYQGSTLGECELTSQQPSPRVSTGGVSTIPRMGYGDYSYVQDKTKGHVGQYYVDKFRNSYDFVKRGPQNDADAFLGRNAKGQMLVPEEGIPQISEGILARDPSNPEDPRVAEAKGELYPWDPNYKDPKFAPSTYADIDDESVADSAFQSFRASLAEERGAALTAMDFAAQLKTQQLKEGLSEKYLLCLEGQLDKEYARMQKINDMPFFTPTGQPQTEIPGIPYMGSVGALDFQKKPGEDIAFWKSDAPAVPAKRPPGSEAPELPYNTSPSIEQMKESQAASGVLSPSE